MREFYKPFAEDVKKAQAEMPVTKSGPEPIGRNCPNAARNWSFVMVALANLFRAADSPNAATPNPGSKRSASPVRRMAAKLVERKTRKGRTFFGCVNYPNCDFTSWKRPLTVPCPKCSGMLVIANKREAQCTNCHETFLLEEIIPETVE